MTRQEIDILLITKAKQRDQKAFTDLFNQYYNQALNFSNAIVKNKTEAEDLTMISFEKAFKKIESCIVMTGFKTWLFTIVKHTCFDYLDFKKRTFGEVVDISYLHWLKSEVENPEQQMISKQTVSIIEESITELHPRLQQAFEMKEEGMKYREIAKELGVSINTITGRFRYVRMYIFPILTKKLVS
jgi:RNA polymerase sigma factor (sigma-70 family)